MRRRRLRPHWHSVRTRLDLGRTPALMCHATCRRNTSEALAARHAHATARSFFESSARNAAAAFSARSPVASVSTGRTGRLRAERRHMGWGEGAGGTQSATESPSARLPAIFLPQTPSNVNPSILPESSAQELSGNMRVAGAIKEISEGIFLFCTIFTTVLDALVIDHHQSCGSDITALGGDASEALWTRVS